MASIRPLNDYVIVDPDPIEIHNENPEVARIVKEGVIQIPDVAEFAVKKSAATGSLVSWGDKCRYRDHYSPGVKVQFGRYCGDPFVFEGKKYRLINERDIHWVNEL